MKESTFLASIHDNPGDNLTWLAMADWLEESGQLPRAELVRLMRDLHNIGCDVPPKRPCLEARLQYLLSTGVSPVIPEILTKSGMHMCLIPAGEFMMGSHPDDPANDGDELYHPVRITRPFYMGACPVTVREWCNLIDPDLAFDQQDYRDMNVPVRHVGFDAAKAFIYKLNEIETDYLFRLPTEAEWEYACRAYTTTPYNFGNRINDGLASFRPTYDKHGLTQKPVRIYLPNAFGLYDMHGGVNEWCLDSYERDFCLTDNGAVGYDGHVVVDPLVTPVMGRGAASERMRSINVVRGGSYDQGSTTCRSAYRNYRDINYVDGDNVGLRLVCVKKA